MDLPYTCSEDSTGLNKSHGECKYYSSNSLVLNTPNPYEETEISGDSCKNFKLGWAEPPVEIHEECTTDIDLPLLVWHGYDVVPKILSVCNTGRTIAINGQWATGRPYIEGGPLNGKYVFSQIHFHCPSEHEIDGRRYPLEMHVVHYKTSYLTQERAMHEKDGTLVLVYLFQAVESRETILSRITRMSRCLEKVNARVEISQVRLSDLVKPFFCNYYVYWGSVMMKKSSYILQWIINCSQSQVTKEEVNALLGVLSACTEPATKGPKMKPHNSIIYRVGENYDVIAPPCPAANRQASTATGFVIEPETANTCLYTPACACLQQHAHCTNYAPRSGGCAPSTPNRLDSNNHRMSGSYDLILAEAAVSAIQSRNQNLCGSCGGLEAEITATTYICKCKPKARKICKSCGGSKSGVSWCKQKWNQCKSKCSLRSKTSSCSNTDTSCKKCKKKRKSSKKNQCAKESSESSGDEKHYDVKKTPRRSSETVCLEKKPMEEKHLPEVSFEVALTEEKPAVEAGHVKASCKTPEKKSETCSNNETRESSLDESCEASYDIPYKRASSSSSCSCSSQSTSCSSATVVNKKKKKTKKKPKDVCEKKRVTSVKQKEKKVETIKKEGTDCDDKKPASVKTRKESKSSSVKEDEKSKDSSKTGKKSKTSKQVKSKDKLETSEKSSEEKKKSKIVKEKKGKEQSDEVTTLFVKMPENLFATGNISNFSCSDLGLDEKKVVDNADLKSDTQEQGYFIENFSTTGLKMPIEDISSRAKELCLQMKHCFQSEKSDLEKTDCTNFSQEYQVSIVCDSNVLQEYKGMFQPKEISLGSFEKLQLVPKYQEPDDLAVRLQECIIKKPSSDKFCIDSKFLLKCWKTEGVFPSTPKVPLKSFIEKIVNSVDAETQYSTEKIGVNDVTPLISKCRSVQTDECCLHTKDKLKNFSCKKLDLNSQSMQTEMQDERKKGTLNDLTKCKTRILKTTSEPEFPTTLNKLQKNQYINLLEAKPGNSKFDKAVEKLECKIKLVKNPQNSTESVEADSSSKEVQKKEDTGKSDLEIAKRNTVYFMYDRIEKDPLTGKKIFMGRFRTKEDLRILKEHKITSKADSLKSFGTYSTSDKSLSAESRSLEVEKSNEFLEKKDLRPERQELPGEEKDEVSVHKFEPNCLNLTQFKAQNSNLVVADVVKWFQDDGENLEVLAGIIGIDKKNKSKIFERPGMTESVGESFSTEDLTRGGNPAVSTTPLCQDKATMWSSHSLTAKIAQNIENSIGLRTADSNSVIIVPVEVESWSKIEVVLIERPDDKKAINSSKKYIPFP